MRQRHWRRVRYGLLVGAVALLTGAGARADEQGQDCEGGRSLALVNGVIHTMDAKNSKVSSLLIRNGKFAEVGRRATGGDGRCTTTINLHGRTVVPGIIDDHNHIILLGLRPGHDTRLENATSIQEVLDTLKARAAGVAAGEWITSIGGFSRNQFFLADGAAKFPTRTQLDSVTPNNPVLLFEGFTGPSVTNRSRQGVLREQGHPGGG